MWILSTFESLSFDIILWTLGEMNVLVIDEAGKGTSRSNLKNFFFLSHDVRMVVTDLHGRRRLSAVRYVEMF